MAILPVVLSMAQDLAATTHESIFEARACVGNATGFAIM